MLRPLHAALLLLLILPSTSLLAQAPETNPAPISSPPAVQAGDAQPAVQAEDERLPFMDDERRAGRSLAEAEPPSIAGLLARTLGALLVIIGLIVAGTWGMRRFGRGNFGRTSGNAPALELLSTISLGERRALSVVRFGAETLLIGSTPQGITLLASQKSEQEQAETADGNDMPVHVSVADLLQREEGATDACFARELTEAQQREKNRNG